MKIAGYTAIAETGISLVKLLQKHLIPELIVDKEKIALCSPAEKGDLQLTLYLYRIEECREFVITEMSKLPNGDLKHPPVPFNLQYLITAYSKADIKSKAIDEQKILGKVVQVLGDNAILDKNELVGTLMEDEQEIRVQMKSLNYDEMMRIWNFNGIPYSLSVVYTVGPILIDSTRVKKVKRVVESRIEVINKDGR